jgi:succinyl-diaminopimelate desuccinylase
VLCLHKEYHFVYFFVFKMKTQDLIDLIDSEKFSHISFLQSLVQAPTPNPPGDTVAAAAVITTYLSQAYISPRIIAPQPHMPNVVHDFTCGDSNGPRLILNGHLDVFPANPEDWPRSPWSGEQANGRIYGRGTVDMKAGTAASIIAYRYLYQHRQHLRGSIGLCAVSDEETGGKFGSRYLLELGERWKGDCMINAEPGGLETIRFAEKGTLRLTFTVKTEGAHGAYLHRSKSANRIAAHLIVDLGAIEEITPHLEPDLEEYMKREDVREAVDEAMGVGAKDIILKATLNIGVLKGGLKVNMIPDQCVFEADIRLPLGLEAAEVMDIIHGILERYPEAEVKIQEAASNPAAKCAFDHPMVGILERSAERVTGKKPVQIASIGATDCKFWRYKGVPAYVFGLSPEGMANVDESIDIEQFLAVLKTHVLAAWEYLGGPK